MSAKPSTQQIISLFKDRFDAEPALVSSAPGRVEVIGNHTDYNGGTVIGACIDKRLQVAIRLREDGVIRLVSATEPEAAETEVELYAEQELPLWTAYPLGIFDEFRMHEAVQNGFDFAVTSTIPTGEGLSSSAAIELATALALNELLERDLPVSTLVGLSHRAENRFVGVPCGLLDQSVVGFGKDNGLIVLDASTGRHHVFPLSPELRLWVFRTHIRHELKHSPYETRHRECRNILIALDKVIPGIRHLAHLHPIDIKAYDVIMNETLVRRAQHVVDEQRRVGQFLRSLQKGELRAAGKAMTDSHHSSRTLFENSSPELDFLVEQLTTLPDVLGARLTGAGWGGAVLALTTAGFTGKNADQIADVYESTFESRPGFWTSSVTEGARIDWISTGEASSSSKS